ncbi:MAG: hypothetical protein QGF31_06895, partial [Nitrospinota bacterium]|nr:hypothetical protein [Nitrospinota bacterium]
MFSNNPSPGTNTPGNNNNNNNNNNQVRKDDKKKGKGQGKGNKKGKGGKGKDKQGKETNNDNFSFCENNLTQAVNKLEEALANVPMSREEQIQRATQKLSTQIPAKARRKLKRLILFSQRDEITLPKKILSFTTETQTEFKETPIILDSGTVHHINRNKHDFSSISNRKVRIKGVAGTSAGLMGVLKPSVLGINIPAVYFKDLPIDCLISVEGLKLNGWETHFNIEQNLVRNRRTGVVLYPETNKVTRLPTLKLSFSQEANELPPDVSFLCSPCNE